MQTHKKKNKKLMKNKSRGLNNKGHIQKILEKIRQTFGPDSKEIRVNQIRIGKAVGGDA